MYIHSTYNDRSMQKYSNALLKISILQSIIFLFEQQQQQSEQVGNITEHLCFSHHHLFNLITNGRCMLCGAQYIHQFVSSMSRKYKIHFGKYFMASLGLQLVAMQQCSKFCGFLYIIEITLLCEKPQAILLSFFNSLPISVRKWNNSFA